ncbi:interleukin-13 receptor subunit alpha-1 [Gadus chalcogrammus]|uniref:interleukin-13 receptor subunit alpha-1 n=1 Tax=Gadus chalcogrammus TaxID=1042646 RepID=UPI0024C4A78B|nr:interleukin-13 receptor subunit alpha-1 [Gadus chalcogrammus]
MITLLKMFGLLWIAPLVQCQTGSTLSSPSTVQLPPLANVSLSWVTDFCYKLSWSWTPPVENQSCEYDVAVNTRKVRLRDILRDTLRYDYDAMQGGLLKSNLSAICGDRRSPPVFTNLTFPELVKDFKCALHSRTSLNCTWRPAQQVADVHLYYWTGGIFASKPKGNCAETFDLVECPVYQTDANGSRTGCVLHNDLPCKSFRSSSEYGFSCRVVWFLFNSTVDGTLARNTFETSPSKHMQPAVIWTGEEDYDHNKLTIRWTPVDLPGGWDYILDYTKCGKRVNETMSHVSDHKVLLLDHCAFNITMKAIKYPEKNGESLPGPYRVYGKNTNPHTALILACTLIPGAVVVIVVMAFVCFRRHSESIFPQVPAPQDFLPDMLKNNNNKIHKAIYVPAPEEEPQNVRFDTKPESRSDMSS